MKENKSIDDILNELKLKEKIYKNIEILKSLEDNINEDYEEFLSTYHLYQRYEDNIYINKIKENLEKLELDNPNPDPIEFQRSIHLYALLNQYLEKSKSELKKHNNEYSILLKKYHEK